MNIHEYQAKKLFETYNIPVPAGIEIHSAEEIDEALQKLNKSKVVIKSQIHAGGRGKGVFSDGFKKGVQICESQADAKTVALRMLNNTLITIQTGPVGKLVQTVYFTEVSDIKHEYYLSMLLDRSQSKVVIIGSTEGGVNIEDVAKTNHEKIIRVYVEPLTGLSDFQARQIAFGLGFSGDSLKQMIHILKQMYKLYQDKDASLIEINPLILTPDDKILALDAKITFDDNGLFRHKDILELRDLNEEDPQEIEASKHGLNYIALDGSIACMVNGAGLAMGTMDIIQHFGGKPANFLDVGGSANEKQITSAFEIILSNSSVKGILVNIFGGIMKCDTIAQGIINAVQNVKLNIPLVVRLEGTNVEKGKEILRNSGIELHSADSLEMAAKKIVELTK